MSAPMEDSTAASLHASAAGSRALPASPHARSILDECVDEFTRRLQACLALPDDDDRFWERVRGDIRALRARCQPGDAFAFELKAARVLAEYGFTAYPPELMSSLPVAPDAAPQPRAFTLPPRGPGSRAA
jgi:hypothetical protein